MRDGAARRISVPPGAPGDAYSELLSGTRRLPREQRTLREEWLGALSLDGKDDLLFEFEVLLKAAACFSNPRNHPGPPRRSPVVAHDFRPALQVFRDGMQRAVSLARHLLGPLDRAFVFHRYLETVLPEDQARTRLLSEGPSQATPEQSLTTLRHGLTGSLEVVDGVLRLPRVPFRSSPRNRNTHSQGQLEVRRTAMHSSSAHDRSPSLRRRASPARLRRSHSRSRTAGNPRS